MTFSRKSDNTDIYIMTHNSGNTTVMKQQKKKFMVGVRTT